MDLGLPDWKKLVHRMAATRKLDPEKLGEWQDLPLLLDLIEGSDERKRDETRELLFADLPVTWVRDPQFAESPTWELARLAILVACLGARRPWHVVTYNYDTTLEEAIHALGFRPVSLVPCGKRLEELDPPTCGPLSPIRVRLERRAPVRVLHAHGVLLRTGDRDREPCHELRASAHDYDQRIGAFSDVSNRAQFGSFFGLNCLFYGWSFKDYSFRTNLSFSADMVELRPDEINQPRHVGLLKSPDSDDPTANEMDRRLDDWLPRQRVARAGRKSYAQHKRFVRRMNLEARRRDWIR